MIWDFPKVDKYGIVCPLPMAKSWRIILCYPIIIALHINANTMERGEGMYRTAPGFIHRKIADADILVSIDVVVLATYLEQL